MSGVWKFTKRISGWTVLAALFSPSAMAYLVVENPSSVFALLYVEKDQVVHQPCGRLPRELSFPQTPLTVAYAECTRVKDAARPNPYKTDHPRYLSSFFALNAIPNHTPDANALGALAVKREQEFRTNRTAAQEQEALFQVFLQLHTDILQPLEDPTSGTFLGEGSDLNRYNAQSVSALSPTLSNGNFAVKIGTGVLPANLDSSCPHSWVPMSLQTFLEFGADGTFEQMKLLEWLQSDVWQSKQQAVTLLTWQNWFEKKAAFNNQVGYVRHKDTYSVTVSETSLTWMKAQSPAILEHIRSNEVMFTPNLLPQQGKPFSAAPANQKLWPICFRRHGKASNAPPPETAVLLTLDDALRFYRTTQKELARVASIDPSTDTVVTPMAHFGESVLAQSIDDSKLNTLYGLHLEEWASADKRGRDDYAWEQQQKAEQARQAKLAQEAEVRRQQQAAAEAQRQRQIAANQKWYRDRREVLNRELDQIAAAERGIPDQKYNLALAGLIGIAGNRGDIGQQAVNEIHKLESNEVYYRNRRAAIRKELDAMPY